jgi:hypothetical protein
MGGGGYPCEAARNWKGVKRGIAYCAKGASMTKPMTKPVKLDQDATGKQKIESQSNELSPEDFYYEGPYMVFTAAYHLKRGYCCNSGCRHCPYK